MSDPLFRRWVLRGPADLLTVQAFLETYALDAAKDDDDPLVVELTRESEQRSDEANAFYWAAIVNPIAEQAVVDGRQFAPKVWHEELKERFSDRVDRAFGPSVAAETHKMSRKRFWKYCLDCEAWAAGPPLNVRFTERTEPPPWLGRKQ